MEEFLLDQPDPASISVSNLAFTLSRAVQDDANSYREAIAAVNENRQSRQARGFQGLMNIKLQISWKMLCLSVFILVVSVALAMSQHISLVLTIPPKLNTLAYLLPSTWGHSFWLGIGAGITVMICATAGCMSLRIKLGRDAQQSNFAVASSVGTSLLASPVSSQLSYSLSRHGKCLPPNVRHLEWTCVSEFFFPRHDE